MARTDNDSWDLASSVGSTATMVAAQRALSNREGLIFDPYAEPLVRSVGLDFFVKALDGEINLNDVDPRFNVRRAAEGMAVRTRHFDTLFTDAIAAGVRQAVILAAGLDARAYRLAWPAGTTVYELDQPEVIAFKSDTLAQLGAEPAADRRAVAVDLRDDWPKALLDNGFDPTQPTAWIAEGLLIYLPPEAQDLLFDRIDELSAPGSRVATEHIPDISAFNDERAQEIAARFTQYGHNIEMSELIYQDERNDVIEYLTARGWDVTAQKVRDAYAANGFEFPEDGAIGFFADMSYLTAIKG
ncbi:class I SAM-dependent methyltransferase [Mycobacterium barrassiae]|uniref:class I SAM-dependent methyltransferase n=1 Tax=Mycobacterium barrassiae TaxID=319709 RepID=UPI0022658C72|nr:class I SAM-dependent methyltransferase [Mycobacterium barrassiae]MCV7302468.1 class I SAM-dependent methyltransferase [Mycobacterium barrassiae]